MVFLTVLVVGASVLAVIFRWLQKTQSLGHPRCGIKTGMMACCFIFKSFREIVKSKLHNITIFLYHIESIITSIAKEKMDIEQDKG